VRPENVTPHYWAAGEMLLLQLAMLAEVHGPPEDLGLVIGAGIPSDWLGQCFAVGPIGTSAGKVQWSWDGRTVHVVSPVDMAVRLGAGFPTGTPVRVEREHEGTTRLTPNCAS